MRDISWNRIVSMSIGVFLFSISLIAEIWEFGGVYAWYSFLVDFRERNLTVLDAIVFCIWWPFAWFSLFGAVVSLFNIGDRRFLSWLSWGLISMTIFFPAIVFSLVSIS